MLMSGLESLFKIRGGGRKIFSLENVLKPKGTAEGKRCRHWWDQFLYVLSILFLFSLLKIHLFREGGKGKEEGREGGGETQACHSVCGEVREQFVSQWLFPSHLLVGFQDGLKVSGLVTSCSPHRAILLAWLFSFESAISFKSYLKTLACHINSSCVIISYSLLCVELILYIFVEYVCILVSSSIVFNIMARAYLASSSKGMVCNDGGRGWHGSRQAQQQEAKRSHLCWTQKAEREVGSRVRL